jgi:hypothetical protein
MTLGAEYSGAIALHQYDRVAGYVELMDQESLAIPGLGGEIFLSVSKSTG